MRHCCGTSRWDKRGLADWLAGTLPLLLATAGCQLCCRAMLLLLLLLPQPLLLAGGAASSVDQALPRPTADARPLWLGVVQRDQL